MCQIFLILRGPGCCSSSTGVLHFRKARIAVDAKLSISSFGSPFLFGVVFRPKLCRSKTCRFRDSRFDTPRTPAAF